MKKLDREYTGDIIVPMTLYMQPGFDEMFDGLRKTGVELRHFQLEVDREQIIARLQERDEALIEWGIAHVDEIIEAFKLIPEEEKIVNQWQSAEAVAQLIVEKLCGE